MSKTQMIVLLSTVLLLGFLPQQNLGQTSNETQVGWMTYSDSRFDFSIQYPADWYILSRDDSNPSATSSVVTFTSIDPSAKDAKEDQDIHEINGVQFVVGHYLAEFKSDHNISDWTDAYETVSNSASPEEVYRHYEKTDKSVDSENALSVKGESVLLEFQVTNVPHGEIVWFIWSNIGDSAKDEQKTLYDQVVASFSFGENTPKSLPEIYGDDFKPQPLEPRNATSILDLDSIPSATINLPSPASNWKAPIASGNQYDVNCGSSFHIDDENHKYSRYAADIAMYKDDVKSSHMSWVDFAGWANGGWGNLVMASTDHLFSNVYTLHYAHLKSISVSGGQQIGNGSHIGTSGNTGTSAYHLHFHIRSSTNSVDLTGMDGFYPDSDYPDNYATCGYVQR